VKSADTISAYPLAWPAGWPRTSVRGRSRFGATSMHVETREVLRELGLLGVERGDAVISTNVELRLDGLPRSDRRPPSDPGVAVYFRQDGEDFVLACDRWNCVEHNLSAIARHIAALRAQERWGVGSVQQAFAGYRALPPTSAASQSWREVLGVNAQASLKVVRAAWRALVKEAHPDAGGSTEAFMRVNDAWAQAQRELAGADA
jgi:hypothetical protein